MRKKQEGYYTKWHADLAYPLLHPVLTKRYPGAWSHPDPDDVRPLRNALHQVLSELSDLAGKHGAPDKENDGGDQKLRLQALEQRRSILNEQYQNWITIPTAPISTSYFDTE